LKASQLAKLRNIPRQNAKQLFDFIWEHGPLDQETSKSYLKVDDLVLLSEFDNVTSAVATAWAFIEASSSITQSPLSNDLSFTRAFYPAGMLNSGFAMKAPKLHCQRPNMNPKAGHSRQPNKLSAQR
jgi:hypothetical protein